MKTRILLLVLVTSALLGSHAICAASGLQKHEIEGVYMRTVTRYGSGGVYVKNAVYLLLKDGSIYKNLSGSPYALNVKASKQKEAKHWGRWRRNGNRIVVTWPGKKRQTWKKWFVTQGAKKGERISGAFQSSDPFTGAKVFNFNTIAFTDKGQYYWTNAKGGETSWRSIISESKTRGRYELDGYAITFHNEDGTRASYVFYFYPRRRDAFGIGKSHFLPLKQKR